MEAALCSKPIPLQQRMQCQHQLGQAAFAAKSAGMTGPVVSGGCFLAGTPRPQSRGSMASSVSSDGAFHEWAFDNDDPQSNVMLLSIPESRASAYLIRHPQYLLQCKVLAAALAQQRSMTPTFFRRNSHVDSL